MVVHKRYLVNILFSFTINPTNSLQDHSTTILINIDIDTHKGWSTSHKSNSSRELLVFTNTSSVAYINYIQVIANCPI